MIKLLQLSPLILLFLVAAGGLYAQNADSTGKTVDAGADTLLAKPEKDCQQKAIGNQFRKKEKTPKLENPIIFIVLFVPHLYLKLTTT